MTGEQLNDLATSDAVAAVTEDAPVRAVAYGNLQTWPQTIGAQWGPAPKNADFPTIAIVDSGVQVRSDFSGRIRTQVDFTGGERELAVATDSGTARSSQGLPPEA